VNDQPTDTTAGTISNWGVGTCLKTSCTLSPTTNKIGTIWWAVSAKKSGSTDFASANCPSKDTITTNAARPNTSEESKTDAQKENDSKMADEYASSEVTPADGESWADF